MKYFILTFMLTMSVAADDDFYTKKFNFLEREQLKVAVNQFREISEKALTLRGQLVQFINLYEAAKGKVLTGADLERIQINLKAQLGLRQRLFKFIHTYKKRPFYEEHEDVLFSSENIVKGGTLGIAAASLLFDNYALCLSLFQDNGKIRRVINKGDKGYDLKEDSFKAIVESFHSPEKRKLMRGALKWYNENEKLVHRLQKSDDQMVYLANLLELSPSVKDIQDGNSFGDYFKVMTLTAFDSEDVLISVGEGSMNSVSKVFGNSVGLVQTRKGLLLNKTNTVSSIKAHLKPMDILLEKTPFRLTDKFIPGHFGHVAIWVGSEKELKELGLWEHPVIKPHQNDIRQGKCVLEALRSGVQLNKFEKFMDVDDVAILRAHKGNTKELEIRAFRQLGKEYDFNFDVETLDKIVCSELVYQVFTDIKWPTERALGRHTISPDNVAIKAHNGPFKMILFYHDGGKAGYDKYKDLLELK